MRSPRSDIQIRLYQQVITSLTISITLQSQYIWAYRVVSSIIVSSIIVSLINVVLQSHTVITLVYSIKSTLTQRLWQWK